MKILLTGASGFLGKIIYNKLVEQKKQVMTLSRAGAMINIDLSKVIPNLENVDLVVHSAGKAHFVPKSEAEKQEFFDVNVKGTENLLLGLSNLSILPNSFVFISSVAVYGCESGKLINESYGLNAKDPYGRSKIEAERIVEQWCKTNDVICVILRLPLLVGVNPPGNLGSMIKGIENGYYFNIGGGKARKSMVLAEDVADFIPKVAAVGGIYNLTDGTHPDFFQLSSVLSKQKNKKKPFSIPLIIANIIGHIGDLFGRKILINSSKLKKITTDLTFDDSKVRREQDWKPRSILDYLKENDL